MESWKETAFIECCFFIDLLAFKQGKLCPGVGFVSFFDPGKAVLGWGF